MKKKILALVLAASAVMSGTAFAEPFSVVSADDTKAILMCYDDNGRLVYSSMYKAEDGEFNINVPSQYDSTKKKIYFVDTETFMDVKANEAPDASATPKPTSKPSVTDKPDASATPKPTNGPSSPSKYPSVYEREVDAIYAPALVKDIETRVNNDNEDMYAVTLMQHGEEKIIGIEADLAIATAPEEYSYMQGQTVASLQKGDIICLAANPSGDTIKTVDFIFRPTEADIATGTADYGTNFEKLFVSDSKVAGKWTFRKYGEKASSDKYQYAFGIVGKKDGNTLTLINKEGSEDKCVEVDMQKDTIVYTCDVSAKEYELEIGTIADIRTTIPKSAFSQTGAAELTSDYSYNYALARIVNGTATDIIVYNNYNS